MPVMKTGGAEKCERNAGGRGKKFFALFKVRSPFGVLHADTSFLFLYLFIPINYGLYEKNVENVKESGSLCFFGSTKSVEKLRKLSLFRAEKWCIIKIVLFQVSEKQEIS